MHSRRISGWVGQGSFSTPNPPSYFIYLGGNQYIEPFQSTAYVIADLEYIQVGPGREAGTRVSS